MRGNNLPLRNADTSGISDEWTITVASVGELKEKEFAAGREGDKSLDQGDCNRLGKIKESPIQFFCGRINVRRKVQR